MNIFRKTKIASKSALQHELAALIARTKELRARHEELYSPENMAKAQSQCEAHNNILKKFELGEQFELLEQHYVVENIILGEVKENAPEYDARIFFPNLSSFSTEDKATMAEAEGVNIGRWCAVSPEFLDLMVRKAWYLRSEVFFYSQASMVTINRPTFDQRLTHVNFTGDRLNVLSAKFGRPEESE
jgi:hypothetical protein